MTDEEIQKEAEKFGLAFYDCVEYQEDVADALEQAYIAGAKENGVVWHDLRKNPDDLPKDIREVLDQNGVHVRNELGLVGHIVILFHHVDVRRGTGHCLRHSIVFEEGEEYLL